MSAAVIHLPTAAREPVVNPRERYFPKGCNVDTSLRNRRGARELQRLAGLWAADREKAIKHERISISVMEDMIEKSRRKLVELSVGTSAKAVQP